MIVCIPPYQAKLKIKFVLFYTLIKRLFMCNLLMLINKKIGLYAIAYATSLCHGDDVKYNSQEMRQHLMHCLEAGIITRFPSTHRTNGPPLAEEDIPVYCYCRIRQKGNMIECSNCEEWFHLKYDHSVSRKNWKKPSYSWLCRNCV